MIGIGLSFSPGSMGGASEIDALAAILSPNGEDYAYWDFTALDRLFQEHTGPTPANDPNEVIGLAIGRSKQGKKTFQEALLAQPELVTNGGFSSGTIGWTGQHSGALTNVANELVLTSAGSGTSRFSTPVTCVVGKMYRLTGFGRRGTTSSQLVIAAASNAALNSAAASSAQNNPTVPTLFEVYFIATATTMYVGGSMISAGGAGQTAIWDNFSCKEVPARYATQAITGYKPQLQTGGAKFDGTDDRILTDWIAAAGAGCIIAQIDVPPTIAFTQVVAGCLPSASAYHLLGLSTGGNVRVGAGNNITNFGTSLISTSAVIGMSFDAGTCRAFVNGSDYTMAYASTPDTTNRFSIGSATSAGESVSNNFFGGAVKRIAFGKKYITPAQFQQIRQQWLAA